MIHRQGQGRSFEAVEFATLEWVDWFNNRRLLEPIGNVPPAEAEARYYAQVKVQALATLYCLRLLRHLAEPYAASAAGGSWLWRTVSGVWNPCRSMSHVPL